MFACLVGNTDAINVFFNAGADLHSVDASGKTCLYHAVDGDFCTKVLQAIISHGVDVNAATNKNTETAIMLACEKGNKHAIDLLFNAGADPNIADADGNTCLHHAADSDYCKEVLQAIISHGVDVNATNKNKVTALMTACEKGNKDAMIVLLNAGADPDIADANGQTCLHHAVATVGSKDVLQTIISHCADVNTANKKKLNTINDCL